MSERTNERVRLALVPDITANGRLLARARWRAVVPPLEPNAVFITTNTINTYGQTRGSWIDPVRRSSGLIVVHLFGILSGDCVRDAADREQLRRVQWLARLRLLHRLPEWHVLLSRLGTVPERLHRRRQCSPTSAELDRLHSMLCVVQRCMWAPPTTTQ